MMFKGHTWFSKSIFCILPFRDLTINDAHYAYGHTFQVMSAQELDLVPDGSALYMEYQDRLLALDEYTYMYLLGWRGNRSPLPEA